MNAISVALVWCVVQVTLVAVASGGVYLVVRRWRPGAATPAVLSGLAAVVGLSLWALSPWPRWSFPASPPVESAAVFPADESTEAPDSTVFLATVSRPASNVEGSSEAGDADAASPSPAQPVAASAERRVQPGRIERTKPAPPTSHDGPWLAIVTAVLLTAMLCGLGRLVLGIVAVGRERRRSWPVRDRELLELVDALRELGCPRRVEVRQSDALATPATIGWRRPVLLLPNDWARWTPNQHRAVLAHEIVHARSHDFLALLVGQVGLVPHFYHPLVHWLVARLRLEQELAADAAAAAVSGGPRRYLATLAELALCQQDRRAPWPARTFLPTPTTFLRRIAMLQNSKTRVERLSPTARLATVATVLLCGVLAAGFRGPGDVRSAMADEKEKPSAVATVDVAADSASVDDCIDTTHMMEGAAAVIVLRPAALLRPELAALAKRLEESGCVVPKGSHLADFRQITAFVPEAEIPSGPREVVVWQWVKPVADEAIAQRGVGKEIRIEDRGGKKVYHFPSGRLVVLADDHTVVEGPHTAVDVYLSGKVGVLPRWLPAEAWESLRRGAFVAAVDTSLVRREMSPLVQHAPMVPQAALLAISPVWENATWLVLGAELDGRLTIHVEATGKDAAAAESLERAVEAIKTLAQAALENARAAAEKWLSQPTLGNARVADGGRQPNREVEFVVLDAVGRLLADAKVRRDGLDVRLDTSIALDASRLDSLASELVAMMGPAGGVASPATEQGIVALVEDFFAHRFRDVTSRETIEWADYKKTPEGNFSIRYKYRARIWDRETKILNQVFTFDPEGEFVSVKDVLEPPTTKEGAIARVEDFFAHNFRDVTSRETIEWADYKKTPEGNFSIRYKYRARIWDRETKILNQVFTFDPEGEFVSVKDVAVVPPDAE